VEINRNQYFLAGLVLLLLGIQLRMVDSFVLTPKATKLLAQCAGHPAAKADEIRQAALLDPEPAPVLKKTIRPPEWIGWALLSLGAVLILHSWAMPRPD
jgi:hypothetical protein